MHSIEPDSGQSPLGILMLDTKFPRPVGDIGNRQTWSFPVEYSVVQGASPDRVILQNPANLLPEFIEAANALVAAGCIGLTTTCGFLVRLQSELAKAVSVPIATSALLQVPTLQCLLPAGLKVGVITISDASLSADDLAGAGIADLDSVPVVGLDPEGSFAQGILNDLADLDFAACQKDLIEASQRLVGQYPETGAIVLECTNMAPYASAVQRATGRPVFSINTLVTQFYEGLQPRRF